MVALTEFVNILGEVTEEEDVLLMDLAGDFDLEGGHVRDVQDRGWKLSGDSHWHRHMFR
jgi:hypothetical protein